MQETVPGVIKTLLVFASSKYIGHLGKKKASCLTSKAKAE